MRAGTDLFPIRETKLQFHLLYYIVYDRATAIVHQRSGQPCLKSVFMQMRKIAAFDKAGFINGTFIFREKMTWYCIDKIIPGLAFFYVSFPYLLLRLSQALRQWRYLFFSNIYHQCFAAVAAFHAINYRAYLRVQAVC